MIRDQGSVITGLGDKGRGRQGDDKGTTRGRQGDDKGMTRGPQGDKGKRENGKMGKVMKQLVETGHFFVCFHFSASIRILRPQ